MAARIMILAGEASGDLHGGKLVRALRRLQPEAEIFGIGGDDMETNGMELLYHVNQLAYVGFTEVARHYFFFRRVFYHLLDELKRRKPDIVVLIDYPGFNLRFAKRAKRLGAKTFYFIAPQVWAWGQGRAKKMADFIDRMGVIFDFEVPFFHQFGIRADFVGHPLLDGLTCQYAKEEFCTTFALDPSRPIVALLPGSRRQELENLLPPMLSGVERLRQKHPDIQVAISKAQTIDSKELNRLVPPQIRAAVIEEATYDLMKHADAALVASGTATLETALFETPFAIVYRVSPLSYFIGKRLIKIDSIGLVNVVSGKKVIPEYIQHEVTPERLSSELERLLFDEGYRHQQREELKKVKARLGQPGAAERTAKLILEAISEKYKE